MMKTNLRRFLSLLLVGCLLIPLYSTAYAGEIEVSTYQGLTKAVSEASTDDETVIMITDDFSLEGSITIESGKNIRLIDNGTKHTLTVADSYTDTVFKVEEGAVLTLAGSSENSLIIDGNDQSGLQKNRTGQIVDCHGKFILDGAVIENGVSYGNHTGIIYISGSSSEFDMRSGEIRNNTIDASGLSSYNATVHATAGAKVYISGGKITENTTEDDAGQRYCTAGILAYTDGNNVTINMTDGEISNNISSTTLDGGGGVWLCGSNWDWENYARMTMSGGTITGNDAGYGGGGVFIYGLASFKMTGGEITNNTVTNGMGGGVCAYDGLKDQSLSDQLIASYSKAYNLAEFVMEGGTISGNKAQVGSSGGDGGCGGGVYIATMNASLKEGTISDNIGERQGGGIYVGSTPYVLEMENAVIKDNTASILGGGLWFCPTGDVTSVVTNGSAIYDNTAEPRESSAGDDIVIVPQGDTHYADLSVRMLGGGQVSWYRDGHVTGPGVLGNPDLTTYGRYEEGVSEQVTEIQGKQDGLAIKCIASEAAKDLAETQATLLVTGNSSQRGGGIGSNGGVVIGVPDKDYELEVSKDWGSTPEENKVELTVNLKIGDYVLDGIKLNAQNNWTASFYGLPDPGSLKNAEITVVENTPDGFTASYGTPVIDDDSRLIKIVITNTATTDDSGSLKVIKEVRGSGGSSSRDFSFTLYLELNGQPYTNDIKYVKDEDAGTLSAGGSGGYEFELRDMEEITFPELPADIEYEVIEDDANKGGYKTYYDNSVGIIPSGGAETVIVTNRKDDDSGHDDYYGNLKVTKTVKGEGLSGDEEFTFRIIFTKSSGSEVTTGFKYSGSYSGTIYSGDKITLKDGESITIRDIPEGIKYEVIELDAEGYVVSSSGDTGTITTGTKKAEFINTREEPDKTDEPEPPKEPDEPPISDEPDEPDEPPIPDEPTIPEEPAAPETPDKVPQTNDISYTGLWFMTGILCIAAYRLINRRPRRRRRR